MVSQYCPATCSRLDCYSAEVYENRDLLAAVVFEESKCELIEQSSRWGKLIFAWRNDRFSYVWDQITGDIYNDDSISIVWSKCALLIPKTLICTIAKVVSNIAQEKFFDALRAVYYGTYCLGAALYGLVDPYEGRRFYSLYERAYFRDQDYVDRRNNAYMALCFVPINYNVIDKCNRESSVITITRNAIRHKYGLVF